MRKRDLIIEFLQLMFRKGKKAAPRFELGIKDLQSSALPLGHAASKEFLSPLADRISDHAENLLFLSNGHGEDLIALQILEVLHDYSATLSLQILPLVGEGKVFSSAVEQGWLKRVGPSMRLPSGGFSNQSLGGLFRDLAVGLLQLSLKQLHFVRGKGMSERTVIFAVGDLFPLFLAWTSGASFAFLGTPKSDYTWRSGPGHSFSDLYHGFKGSEWDPWEYALMRSSRCKFVAVRDLLTARGLRRQGVVVKAPGNPMMDGLQTLILPNQLQDFRRLILLCGSRAPEAQENFERLLSAAELVQTKCPILIFVALGSDPSVDQIEHLLLKMGYEKGSFGVDEIRANSLWCKGLFNILVGKGEFSRWASWAEVGLATAGTATEQLVGLGIPALSLPGQGPQFKRSFAIRQSRMLGGAVHVCKSPEALASRLAFFLSHEAIRQNLGLLGARRMGPPGASYALAHLIMKFLLGDA